MWFGRTEGALTLDFLRGLLPRPSVARNIAGKHSAKPSGNGVLILVMMEAGRWLSVTELAGLMGCSVGEAIKRVKAADDAGVRGAASWSGSAACRCRSGAPWLRRRAVKRECIEWIGPVAQLATGPFLWMSAKPALSHNYLTALLKTWRGPRRVVDEDQQGCLLPIAPMLSFAARCSA